MQLPVAKKSGGGGGDFKYLASGSLYCEKGKKYYTIYTSLSGGNLQLTGYKPNTLYSITGGATAGAAWAILGFEGNDTTVTARFNSAPMGIYTVE